MTELYGKPFNINVCPTAADSMMVIIGETELHMHKNAALCIAEAITEAGVKMAKVEGDQDAAHMIRAANAHLKYVTQIRGETP